MNKDMKSIPTEEMIIKVIVRYSFAPIRLGTFKL